MEKAYFIGIRNEITSCLNEAKQEVVVAMAWFTSAELFQSLIDCLKRNVKVELVLLDDEINFMYYAPDFNIFIKNGGVLRIAGIENGFMHHKFCVIDNNKAITGSYNWTYYAENRNIENIVITDNKEVIAQYKKEFTNLTSRIDTVSDCPRLEWTEIESCQHIDFDELNYEIDCIAKTQNLPERKVVKSSTVVTIEERPLCPISRFDIGVKTTTGNDNITMQSIIKAGEKLPYTSNTFTLYNYSDHRSNVMFTVLYNDKKSKKLITQKAITEITSNRNDWELTIEVQFTLVPSGELYAEVRCVETGKVMNVKASNIDFVDYAE